MRTRATISIASIPLAILAATSVRAATNFSGTWVFQPSQSKNAEMMQSVQITATIQQTPEALIVTEVSSVKGREATRRLRYDLSGKAVENEGPMGDASQTTTKWVGDKLQTIWTHPGAVAGTQVTSTETRSLSSDGRIMLDGHVRGERPPVVIVFEKR